MKMLARGRTHRSEHPAPVAASVKHESVHWLGFVLEGVWIGDPGMNPNGSVEVSRRPESAKPEDTVTASVTSAMRTDTIVESASVCLRSVFCDEVGVR